MSEPLDVYVLYATDTEQKFIKVADDGCLAIFDNEASAKRAKRRNAGTDYKKVNYYSQKQVDQMQEDNEALRARVAELDIRHSSLKVLADAMDKAIDALCNARNEDDDKEADRLLLAAHEEYLIFQDGSFGREADVVILRKQAEAVEEIVDADPDGRSEDGGALVAMDTIWDYAQDLRTKAAELERQSEGGSKS